MFGRGKITEYGIRTGRHIKWYDSQAARDSALRHMKKAKKTGGTEPKAAQRYVPAKQKDKCSGGTCKRNGYCRKHAKAEGRGYTSAHDIDHGVAEQRRPDGQKY